jgi:hypothetical protein
MFDGEAVLLEQALPGSLSSVKRLDSSAPLKTSTMSRPSGASDCARAATNEGASRRSK